ncbi:DUF5983 family protein, partial [Escherichia coli]
QALNMGRIVVDVDG